MACEHYELRDAMDLKPGDRVITQSGRVEIIVRETTRESETCCTIHTVEHAIVTTWPCPVKVLT